MNSIICDKQVRAYELGSSLGSKQLHLAMLPLKQVQKQEPGRYFQHRQYHRRGPQLQDERRYYRLQEAWCRHLLRRSCLNKTLVEETGMDKRPSSLSLSGTSGPLTMEVGAVALNIIDRQNVITIFIGAAWTQWDVRTGPKTSLARTTFYKARVYSRFKIERCI